MRLSTTLSPAAVRAEEDGGNGTDTTEQTDTVRQEVQNRIQGLDPSDWERVLGGVPEQARGIPGDDALASIIGQLPRAVRGSIP